MFTITRKLKPRSIAFLFLPGIYVFLLQMLNKKISYQNLLGVTFFYSVVLIISIFAYSFQQKQGQKIDWVIILFFLGFFVSLGLSFKFVQSVYSWFLVGLWIIFCFLLKPYLLNWKSKILRNLFSVMHAGVIGLFLILVDQLQTGFSEEEFFVAVQAIELAFFIFLLQLAYEEIVNIFDIEPKFYSSKTAVLTSVSWFVIYIVFLFYSLRSYQRSFYPQTAVLFPGITEESPFLCSELESTEDPYPVKSSQEVLEIAIEKIIENPSKGTPEYGFLSLVTQDHAWNDLFHDKLLEEAESGMYTKPVGSVKYGQLDAAVRIYYYSKVIEKYPGIFSHEETSELKDWFANINRRAMTVEWVDWMYSAAFTMWPEGPYENQEIGAALLSMLLINDLSAPELEAKNIDYMERNKRGWYQRFRNTDDAFVYQPVWITSAYFQSLYFEDEGIEENLQKSFEWLMYQTLPDGSAPQYNFPKEITNASVMLFGAYLNNDGKYLWLADRALELLDEKKIYLYAYPGIENIKSNLLLTDSPKVGTCLLYGDSGLPNQKGPLAPDKIVFRSGWNDKEKYLLINLRSSGWHKYKSTNTITSIFHENQILTEYLNQPSFSWLPEGRSKFRDKRIPRESLNGFMVYRDRVNTVLCSLVTCQSDWAQDPPLIIVLEEFGFYKDRDYGKISFVWENLKHTREIYFFHSGPIFILDTVQGKGKGALNWNLIGEIILNDFQTFVNNPMTNSSVIFLKDIESNEKINVIEFSPNETSQVLFLKEDEKMQILTSIIESYDSQLISFDEVDNKFSVEIIRDDEKIFYSLSK